MDRFSHTAITQAVYKKTALNNWLIRMNQYLTRIVENIYTTNVLSSICVLHISQASRVWARDDFVWGQITKGRGY